MKITWSYKHFNWMRILATVALVCTVALFLFVMIESSMSSTESGGLTRSLYGLFRPAYSKIEESAPKVQARGIHLGPDGYTEKTPMYPGDKFGLKLTFEPASSKTEVVYVVNQNQSDPVASVDSDGIVTILDNAPFGGSASVYAHFASDPSIKSNAIYFSVSGTEKPTADTQFDFKLIMNATNCGSEENPLIVGKRATLVINDNTYSYKGFSFKSSDEDVVTFDQGYFYALSEGAATITITFNHDGVIKEYSLNVVTKVEPGVVIPTAFGGPDVVEITVGKSYNYSSYPLEYYPSNASRGYKVSYNKSSAVYISSTHFTAGSEGTFVVTYTSQFDLDVYKTVTFVIKHVEPGYVDIFGDDRISVYSGASLKAFVGPQYADSDVVWSVVSGKATIDQDGNIDPSNLGFVTIRATSKANPAIYKEKTMRVEFFGDFQEFARKIMGHFLIYTVLGFGFFFSYYLLAKNKKLSVLYAFLSGTFSAFFSEFLQYFAEGRTAKLVDVLLDSIGATCGMMIGLALVAVVCLIWRLISKESFHRIALALRTLNFKTIFTKNDDLKALFSADVYVPEKRISDSAPLEEVAADVQ